MIKVLLLIAFYIFAFKYMKIGFWRLFFMIVASPILGTLMLHHIDKYGSDSILTATMTALFFLLLFEKIFSMKDRKKELAINIISLELLKFNAELLKTIREKKLGEENKEVHTDKKRK